MLNEAKNTILLLRANGYDISGIQALTGLSLTHICEVIYEQNQEDISHSRENVDNDAINQYDGIF